MSHNNPSIPNRWLEYKSVGKRIHITPFLAFKVPLKKTFFSNVSPEQKFSPSDLIEFVPNLSLVIDLTNTEKYYSENDFLNSGIKYKKIPCPGHRIPSIKLIKKFFDIVDDFMEKTHSCNNEDEVRLIGVHCTHGINRTGFFICSYMVNKLGYTSEKAISEFNSAREHEIERKNYLNALKKYDISPLQFQPSSSHHHNASYGGCFGSVQNYGRNVHYPSQQKFNFYDDHPVSGNLSWKNCNQHSFALNEPVLESIDPYFHSVQRKRYRNGRQRKY